LRTELARLRHSTGTSDALCQDAKLPSAILRRLERSPSRSGLNKFNVPAKNTEAFRSSPILEQKAYKAHNELGLEKLRIVAVLEAS
jgi:hypothetical protein